MRTVQINPRWRVQLEGDTDDLDDLTHVLNGSATDEFAYVIVSQDTVKVLASVIWDKQTDVADVQRLADNALRLFCGILTTYNNCGNITTGTVYDVSPDGTYLMSRSTEITIRVKNRKEDRLTPETFKRTIWLAEKNDWVLSALLEINGIPDWFSIYRTIEAIEGKFGRSEKDMIKSSLINGKKLKLIKQMANSFRHLPGGVYKAPVPAIGIDDAFLCVRNTIEKLIETQ